MATGIQNYPHIDISDPSRYPNGNILDAGAGTPPTPVDKLVYADIHQTFDKLLRLTGITANGTPDNEINGYQYIQALQKLISPDFTSTGLVFVNSGSNVWANAGGSFYNVGYRLQINTVTLCGVAKNTSMGSPLTSFIMTIPSDIRPSKTVHMLAYSDMAGGIMVNVIIDAAGNVTCDQSISGNFQVFLDGLSYRIS
jgi:hypothetical protein